MRKIKHSNEPSGRSTWWYTRSARCFHQIINSSRVPRGRSKNIAGGLMSSMTQALIHLSTSSGRGFVKGSWYFHFKAEPSTKASPWKEKIYTTQFWCSIPSHLLVLFRAHPRKCRNDSESYLLLHWTFPPHSGHCHPSLYVHDWLCHKTVHKIFIWWVYSSQVNLG